MGSKITVNGVVYSDEFNHLILDYLVWFVTHARC